MASFFSKAKSKIKSVINSVKNTFSKGVGQTATVNNAVSSASKSNIPGLTFSGGGNLPAGTQFGTQPAVNIQQAYASGGITTKGAPAGLSQVFQNKLPVTISGGQQKVGSGTSSISQDAMMSQYFSPASATTTMSRSSLGAPGIGSSGGGTVQLGLSSAPTSTNPQIDNSKIVGATAGYYTVDDKGMLVKTEDPEADKEETDQGIVDKYKGLFEQLGVRPSVDEDSEVIDARKQRQQIQQALLAPTSELNAVIAKQNSDLLTHRKMISESGGTETGFGGVEAAINYNAAIRALPLQASIASLQGDLKLAQDYLTELRDVKQEQINNQYEYNKGLLNAILPALEKKDERRYQEKITANENARKEASELEDFKADLAITAMNNGGTSQSIQSRIAAAPNKMAAIQAAGQYAGDILGRQIKQAQLDNLYSEIAERDENKTVKVDSANKVIVKPVEAQKLNKELTSTDAYKTIRKGQDSLQFLADFENQFHDSGSTSAVFDPIKNAKLKATYNSTILNLKELFNLGVLNGPDEAILRGVLPDPTNVSNLRKFVSLGTYQPGTATQAGIDNMKKQIETTLDDRFKSIASQYGDYSTDSVTSLKDLQRVYISQKVQLNPKIAQLVQENPDMTYDDIISVISQ